MNQITNPAIERNGTKAKARVDGWHCHDRGTVSHTCIHGPPARAKPFCRVPGDCLLCLAVGTNRRFLAVPLLMALTVTIGHILAEEKPDSPQ